MVENDTVEVGAMSDKDLDLLKLTINGWNTVVESEILQTGANSAKVSLSNSSPSDLIQAKIKVTLDGTPGFSSPYISDSMFLVRSSSDSNFSYLQEDHMRSDRMLGDSDSTYTTQDYIALKFGDDLFMVATDAPCGVSFDASHNQIILSNYETLDFTYDIVKYEDLLEAKTEMKLGVDPLVEWWVQGNL